MKYIEKKLNNQPPSLIQHKNQPHHSYENYSGKAELRDFLLKDQAYLCCYCMTRIQTPTEDKMGIEHLKPFSAYNGENGKPDLRLEYKNLLATCKGGEGGPKHLFHCDKAKWDAEIKLDPTNKQLMDLIKFDANGFIYTDIEEYDREINEVLKLNVEPLRKARLSIWRSLEQIIKKEFGNKPVKRSFINEKIKVWSKCNRQGMAEQYCQVAVYYLKKKLSKAV